MTFVIVICSLYIYLCFLIFDFVNTEHIGGKGNFESRKYDEKFDKNNST